MPCTRARLHELDALRGIAALIVVLYHSLLTLHFSDSLVRRVLDALPTHPLFAGRLAVIFFFVLSGAVLTRALMAETGSVLGVASWLYAARRVVRLCLPALVVLAASAVARDLLWDGVWPGAERLIAWREPVTPFNFIRQALLLDADGDFDLDPVLWSLVHELRLSLLLPLLVAVPALRGPTGSMTVILFGLIAFGASVAGQTSVQNTILLGPTILASLRATAYFALPFLVGAALSLGCWERWQPTAEQRHIALAAALLLLCADSDMATMAASVLFILLSRHAGHYRDLLRTPALLWLGRISFSLYLVHMPVQLALAHGLHDVVSDLWLEPLTIVTSLLAAWGTYHLVERPSLLLSRRIRSPRPATRFDRIAAMPAE